MSDNKKTWDKLSLKYFNNFNKKNINLEAEENIIFFWPVIKKEIRKIKNKSDVKILDFGCGTGEICSEIQAMGFNTTGIDYSANMIKIGKKNVSKNIKLHIGESQETLQLTKRNGGFDIIISTLVFPFIKNIRSTIRNLYRSLNDNGQLYFVVFNPNWVKEALKRKIDYEKKSKNKKELVMNFGNANIVPVYIRTKKDYEKIMSDLKMKKILESYPLFTKKFIKKIYPTMPKNIAECIILGYKK